MSTPYPPFVSLERIAKEKDVPVEAMFKYLILSLFGMNVVQTTQGFSSTADNKTNAYALIQNLMQMTGKGARPPTSVFEIADVFVLAQLTIDRLNAPKFPDAGKNAKVGEALHLVLQDLQNQVESGGLEGRIHLEGQAKQQGWILFGDPPSGDQRLGDKEEP